MIFFVKIGIFCKSIAGEAKTYWMVNWLQLLNKLNFVWRYTKIFIQSSSPKCSIVENVGELMLMALHTHFLPTAAIFLDVLHCFWLFTLWFIDNDASFYYFFHKITNIRSRRCISSSKIRMQFSHTHSATLP